MKEPELTVCSCDLLPPLPVLGEGFSVAEQRPRPRWVPLTAVEHWIERRTTKAPAKLRLINSMVRPMEISEARGELLALADLEEWIIGIKDLSGTGGGAGLTGELESPK